MDVISNTVHSTFGQNVITSILTVSDNNDATYQCGLSNAVSGNEMSPESVIIRFLGKYLILDDDDKHKNINVIKLHLGFVGLIVNPEATYFDKHGDTVSMTCKSNWYNINNDEVSVKVIWQKDSNPVTGGQNGTLPIVSAY